MKKIVLLLAMAAVCVSARAELEDRWWTSEFIVAPGYWNFLSGDPVLIPGEYNGYGNGWYAEVYNVTQAGHTFQGWDSDSYSTEMFLSAGGPGVSPVLGWIDGWGYLIDEAAFGSAKDLDTVQLIIYNNANKNAATTYMESLPLVLPDAPEIPDHDAVRVTFVMPIPEPSTALLLGTGGLVVWFGRRKLNRDTGTKVTPKKMQKVNLLNR